MFFDLLIQIIDFLRHILDFVCEILIQLSERDLLLADQSVYVFKFLDFLFMCLHLGFQSGDVGDLGGKVSIESVHLRLSALLQLLIL